MNPVDVIARQDNQQFENWVQQFRPWVRTMARQWSGLRGLDRQDVEQAAWLGLVEAARSWRPQGVPFDVWARGVMRRRMIDVAKSMYRRKHTPLSNAETLAGGNGEERCGVNRVASPLDQLIEREAPKEWLARLLPVLTPLERTVLMGVLAGDAPRVTARALHISVKSCDNAHQRVKRKARTLRNNNNNIMKTEEEY